MYAAKDRISFKHLNGSAIKIAPMIFISVFFSTTEDNEHLLSKFETLMMRMLLQHIPGLQHLSPALNHDIPHKYSRYMALKSHAVCYPNN